MATLYEIKIKTVSPFINYPENYIIEMFEKFLKNYRDEKCKLGFEAIEIDVTKK